MLDLFDFLINFIPSPVPWRRMSGLAVAALAVILGVLGLGGAVGAWSVLADAESLAGTVVGLVLMAACLCILADVVIGVIAFLRANNEHS